MANEVKYRITAEDQTGPGTTSAKKNIDVFGEGIKKLGVLMASVFAVNKIVDFFKDSAKAYMEAESSQARFQAALMATGKTQEISIKKINDYASALQRATKFEDDAIVSALGQVQALANLNEEGLMKVTPAMLDFGEAIGSVDTASMLIAKTLSGEMNALGRYGIQVDATASKEEKLKQITEQLTAKYGGLAEIMGKTAVGRLTQLKNAWGDVQEEVGRFLLAGAAPLAGALENISNGIKNFLQDSEKMKGFAAIISDLSGGIAVIIEMGKMFADVAWKQVSGLFKTFGDALTVVVGKGQESNAVFKVLGGIMQVITAAFAIQAKFINLWIMGIARLINAVVKSIDILGAFGEALADPLNSKKWQAVADKAGIAANAFADFGKGIVDDVKGIIDETMNQINGFFAKTEENAKKLQDTFETTKKAVQSGISAPTFGGGSMQSSAQYIPSVSLPIGGGGDSMGRPGISNETWGNLTDSPIPGLLRQLGELIQPLLDFMTGLDNVQAVLNPLSTIFKGLADTISGPMNKALEPIVRILTALGKILGELLLPVITFLGNIILAIATFIAGIINAIVDAINFLLGWMGVHVSRIDLSAPTETTETTGGTGAGSTMAGNTQYTAAPVITMNINIYATAITAGDKIMTFRDLAKALNDELNAALELG